VWCSDQERWVLIFSEAFSLLVLCQKEFPNKTVMKKKQFTAQSGNSMRLAVCVIRDTTIIQRPLMRTFEIFIITTGTVLSCIYRVL